MPRIYCSHALAINQNIAIEEDFHYLIHVHRLKTNDELICFNNQQEYLCKITQVKKHFIIVETIALIRTNPSQHPIRLVMSMIKSKRLKWVIEKAVEIGVCEILLAHTHRSQSYELPLDKLYSIAKQALQQSHNMIMPNIEYISMQDLIKQNYNMCILSPDGQHIMNLENNRELDTVFIGPEGGFTSFELSVSYPKLKLGNSILRSETAAILAIHTLQYISSYNN